MTVRRTAAVVFAVGSSALFAYWLSRSERPPVPLGSIVFAVASLLVLGVRVPRRPRRRPRHTAAAGGSATSIAPGGRFRFWRSLS